MRWYIFLILVLLGISPVLAASFSGTQGTASFSYRPDFQSYYQSEGRLQTYWPILTDKQSCTQRQDILLQVAPAGCQPAVVRSDLLAEQNVPVFCQIDALEVNPLLDIKSIENIRFTGSYPKEIVGVGYHPARAALGMRDKLLNNPVINNIGYVVVVLKQNPNEASLPEFVNVTLTAKMEYDASNAFGTGSSEFLLKQMSDDEWEQEYVRSSFWKGRFFVRLEGMDGDTALVSLYDGDHKISSLKVKKGGTSDIIYLPGAYCQAGIQIRYNELVTTDKRATLRVGEDTVEVYEGSRILGGRCTVRNLEAGGRESGSLTLSCGGKTYDLSLSLRSFEKGENVLYIGKDKSISSSEIFTITDNGNGSYLIEASGNKYKVNATDIRSASSDSLYEASYTDAANEAFQNALESYEQVADSYPQERDPSTQGSSLSITYGQQALIRAIDLAEAYRKDATRARLIEKYLELYTDGANSSYYLSELNGLYQKDSRLAGTVVESGNTLVPVKIVSLKASSKKPTATFSWGSSTLVVPFEESKEISQFGKLTLDSISIDRVSVTASCWNNGSFESGRGYTLDAEESEQVCGRTLLFRTADLEKLAKISVIPHVDDAQTETNLTVVVGIEKRAIQLAPNKTAQRIAELNNTIKKWQSVSDNLGNVVSTMKAACFATAGVLTVKNFFTGLSGEGFARKQVMDNYWKGECAKQVSAGKYSTVNECYLEEASKIDQDVQSVKGVLNSVNANIKQSEESYTTTDDGIGGLFGGEYVDRNKAAQDYQKNVLVQKYGTEQITVNGKTSTVSELLSNENGYEDGEFTYDQLREIEFNLQLQKSGASDGVKQGATQKLTDVGERIQDNKQFNQQIVRAQSDSAKGLPGSVALSTRRQQTIIAPVLVRGGAAEGSIPSSVGSEVTHLARVTVPTTEGFSTGTYILGLSQQPGVQTYQVTKIVDGSGQVLSEEQQATFQSTYGIGDVGSSDQITYNNRYTNPEISYYETEPYKGMPAIVPFDTQRGWYAATEQNLPVFGGMGSFESNGRVASFWLCNVGTNGRAQFFEGKGDDICQLVNLNTGQPLGVFPGLSEDEAQRKVNQAVNAIQEAAKAYGSGRTVSIGGEKFGVGAPSANVPGTQCQEFMDPKECLLLFNVCDPVLCPVSRCDLGGTYPVADVVQTGIVGSALLCLPNAREGIAVPVCLTGIKAGIDGYLSILKSQQQCLQESLDTGSLVGICDEITSVYTCEFFWRQVAPAAKILLPKAFEVLSGQNAPRGGGEYLMVQNAWQHTQDSVDYFTNTYAVNSLEAFNIRSVEEAGTTFCRAFISAKAPTDFESLIEPDSPPQFHAWFSSISYSDATVPATSQYKVFYHLFAGNERGVTYSVYLKEPPATSYYQSTPTIQVAGGFVPKGQYKTETKDFTAPEGYKQLCVRVNNKEECGFKEVSSSFALDYVGDSIAKNELTRSDITSQQSCISGASDPAALINPNIQAGVEEAAFPKAYERGIIRICSTSNPASATDPARFVDVGYCDDQKIRCWIDKKSVGDSISDSNIGLKNATITEIEQNQLKNLQASGQILPNDQANALIESLNGRVNSLTPKTAPAKSDELLQEISTAMTKVFFNHDQAKLFLLRATVYDLVAQSFYSQIQQSVIGSNVGTTTNDQDPSQNGNSDSPTQTVDESIEYEFQDGKVTGNNLYYRYTDAWEWSPDQSVWQLASKSLTTDQRSSLGKNAVFIESLKTRNYPAGLKQLIDRTSANKEGGWFASTNLQTSTVGMDEQKHFHIRNYLIFRSVYETEQLYFTYDVAQKGWYASTQNDRGWQPVSSYPGPYSNDPRFKQLVAALEGKDFYQGAQALFDLNLPSGAQTISAPETPQVPVEEPKEETSVKTYKIGAINLLKDGEISVSFKDETEDAETAGTVLVLAQNDPLAVEVDNDCDFSSVNVTVTSGGQPVEALSKESTVQDVPLLTLQLPTHVAALYDYSITAFCYDSEKKVKLTQMVRKKVVIEVQQG